MHANDHQPLIKLLADQGLHFSCSTRSELQQIHRMGVQSHRILLSNPCFHPPDACCDHRDITWATFGSEYELHRIRQHWPRVPLLLQIEVGDGESPDHKPVSRSVSLDQLPHLLWLAHQLQLVVRGTSFHLGSAASPMDFQSALAQTRRVWQVATDMGCHFDAINVGGGFPGVATLPGDLQTIAATIREAPLGPPSDHIHVMAEPGRFFCAEAQTLAVRVIGRRHTNGRWNYYINNSLYQNFSHLLFDHPTWNQPASLDPVARIWGHSSHGNELITDQLRLPELQFGDWLVFPAMGAYTNVGEQPTIPCHVINT
jgi:diaminopimelate decarboxylase